MGAQNTWQQENENLDEKTRVNKIHPEGEVNILREILFGNEIRRIESSISSIEKQLKSQIIDEREERRKSEVNLKTVSENINQELRNLIKQNQLQTDEKLELLNREKVGISRLSNFFNNLVNEEVSTVDKKD